jgi:hypothetical protein
VYGEEHYERAYARNNPQSSTVVSQLSHSEYPSRKNFKKHLGEDENSGSERNDHESDKLFASQNSKSLYVLPCLTGGNASAHIGSFHFAHFCGLEVSAARASARTVHTYCGVGQRMLVGIQHDQIHGLLQVTKSGIRLPHREQDERPLRDYH